MREMATKCVSHAESVRVGMSVDYRYGSFCMCVRTSGICENPCSARESVRESHAQGVRIGMSAFPCGLCNFARSLHAATDICKPVHVHEAGY